MASKIDTQEVQQAPPAKKKGAPYGNKNNAKEGVFTPSYFRLSLEDTTCLARLLLEHGIEATEEHVRTLFKKLCYNRLDESAGRPLRYPTPLEPALYKVKAWPSAGLVKNASQGEEANKTYTPVYFRLSKDDSTALAQLLIEKQLPATDDNVRTLFKKLAYNCLDEATGRTVRYPDPYHPEFYQ